MSERKHQIRQRWACLARSPGVAVLRERVAPPIAWIRRRLSPGEYFGLELTLGVLAFVGGAWLFGGVLQDLIAGDPLIEIDKEIALWLHRHENEELTAFMSAVSWFHTWPIALLSLLFLAYLGWMRQWRWALIAICTVPGGMFVNTLVKLALHRERPSLSGLADTLKSYSFPSGHTVAATLIYSLFAAYLIGLPQSWKGRASIVTFAVLAIVLVALSRVLLGVHYLSDVLAAVGEGVAWFALCHVAVNTLWHRRGLRMPQR